MKKITLFVVIIWAAIGMSVAAISIPTLSSDVGKSPAIPQNTINTVTDTNSGNTTDASTTNDTQMNNRDKEKNNSNSGRLKKQNSFKSITNHGNEHIKTKNR
ncbi:hypothetical protein FGU46_03835 [Methanobacterium sp. CWC-01]|uniref:hypothetical protein n=1 Tax=Methanobacterium aridiramus TaxID=2584467 RepID=UPI002576CC72|nr:hypothetical protein [Methanobacterium sp. CWC-01]WJI09287.1 hypothetical protein FGU46_03835 [Methanobacterium sp. CWC-01]